jgi:hypothetical protein
MHDNDAERPVTQAACYAILAGIIACLLLGLILIVLGLAA